MIVIENGNIISGTKQNTLHGFRKLTLGFGLYMAIGLALIVAIQLTGSYAAACTIGADTKCTSMGAILCTVAIWMYSDIGRALATLGIIILGIGATLGKVSWGLAVVVAVGISGIFNSAAIVNAIVGSDSGYTC